MFFSCDCLKAMASYGDDRHFQAVFKMMPVLFPSIFSTCINADTSVHFNTISNPHLCVLHSIIAEG